jgi:nicotinamidase-related amidase
MDQDVLVDRVVHLARFGMLYRLPVVLSTVNVSTGRNQPTIAPLQDVLPGIAALDRTTINAWEDTEFKQAVRAAGRRKLIMAALWTEACLTFPSLDAMREGYEIYPVTDAVGGTSPEAHQAGLDRIAHAGGQPTSVVQVGCELQRDWARQETAEGFTQILFGGDRPLAGLAASLRATELTRAAEAGSFRIKGPSMSTPPSRRSGPGRPRQSGPGPGGEPAAGMPRSAGNGGRPGDRPGRAADLPYLKLLLFRCHGRSRRGSRQGEGGAAPTTSRVGEDRARRACFALCRIG